MSDRIRACSTYLLSINEVIKKKEDIKADFKLKFGFFLRGIWVIIRNLMFKYNGLL